VRIVALLFLCVVGVPTVRGADCVPDLLSNYVALLSTGCEWGPFTVKDFLEVSSSGSILVTTADITVTPYQVGSREWGMTFSSPLFSVSGSDSVHYEFTYYWDPGDIRSLEDILGDPTVAPGIAMVTTNWCEDAAYIGTFCPGAFEDTTIVIDDGILPILSDITPFLTPAATCATAFLCNVGVYNILELDANGASAAYPPEGFTNIVHIVPEPSTWAAGLLTLSLAIRGLRFKRP
jgi:hypothetical protein